ncbi:MAG: leucine-rich repeat protein [Muribaculaceae bacterium]|nr:leucine-rich repeat protein [Muribaculaceae bacterium]
MRTRIFSLLVVVVAAAITASAYDFKVNGLCYNKNSDGSSVTVTYERATQPRYASLSGAVTIPASVTYSSKTYKVTAIDAKAFLHCTGITSVTVPSSITSIGQYAFMECYGLTTVNWNAVSCQEGDDGFISGCFTSCTSLKSFVFGSGVKKIPAGLCYNLDTPNLTSVTIPNTVTEIGRQAFYNCTGLTSVTIPAAVTVFGNYAFSGCTGLTTVNWNATNCGDNGTYPSPRFEDCTSLKTFNIGSSVKRIPSGLCESIKSLTSVTIPSSVTEIGQQAFSNCTGLTKVTIPASVTTFGSFAFEKCTALTTVNWNATSCTDNSFSSRFEGCTSLKSVVFGSAVKRIPSGLCSDLTSLTSVTIPSSVTEIGQYAFSNTGLTSVTVPAALTLMGDNAFSDCAALTTVNWNATSCKDNTDNTGYTRFTDCTSLKSFVFGSSVKRIPSELCYNLSGLTSVTIPNAVTEIGQFAFSYCAGLTTVTMGTGVKTIGNGAFKECTALNKVNTTDMAAWCGIAFGDNYSNPLNHAKNLYLSGTKVTNLTIPSTVTGIKAYTFYNCTSMTKVTVPSSVTSIAASSFTGCSALATVVWNAASCANFTTSSAPFRGLSAIKTFTFGSTVTKIPAYLCYNLKGLTAVTIPAAVTSIGSSAFTGCTALATVTWNATNCADFSSSNGPFQGLSSIKTFTVGSGVTKVPAYVCYGLSGLTTTTIPSSVTSIGTNAFASCSALATVNWNAASCADFTSSVQPFKSLTSIKTFTFGSTVTKIPAYLCNGLTGLTALTIPTSVTSIGASAFAGCTGLTKVNTTDLAAWCKITFGNNTANPLYCGKNLYLSNSKVTSLTIPSTITAVKDYAFNNCTSVTQLTIPQSVTSVSTSAFTGCTAITSVSWNSPSCPDFTSSAQPFKGLTNIKTFSFLGSVKKVPAYICYNLTGLTTVTIPSSVTSLGTSAFAGCTGLATVNWNAASCGDFTSTTLPFKGLTSIKTFTFGTTVTKIPAFLCNGLTGITAVTIPTSVTSVGSSAFAGCTGLTKVNTTDLAAWCKITFGGNTANPLYCGKNLYLSDSKVTNLTIPSTITVIKDYSFNNCTSVTQLTIHKSVTSVSTSAFTGCTALATVNWNVASCGDFTSSAQPFKSLTNIKTFTFGTTVTKIPAYLCNGLTGITAVTIPASVTSVGAAAFAGCTGLTKVTTPDLAAWCKITFGGNTANPLYYGKNLYLSDSKVTNLTIPSTITAIKDYAFNNGTSLTQLTVHKSVTSVSTSAFTGCTALATVNWNAASCGDFTSSAQPFKGLTNIKTFTLGSTVTKIPAYLCNGLTGLTAITIPRSVKSAGSGAFNGCTGLTRVNISDLETWCAIAFGNASANPLSCAKNLYLNDEAVTELEIPAVVTNVKAYAFYNCTPLTRVAFPSTLTAIGTQAFAGCTGLAAIDSKPDPADVTLGTEVFKSVPVTTCQLRVPSRYASAYRAADQWKDFFTLVTFLDGDVNGDGIATGADVTALYDILLDGKPVTAGADVNGDGEVNGADVTALYNLLLN